MKKYKKSFLGTFIAFFLGLSCCWISSLLVWLGGAALLGTIVPHLENAKPILFGVGGLLGIMTIRFYLKQKRKLKE